MSFPECHMLILRNFFNYFVNHFICLRLLHYWILLSTYCKFVTVDFFLQRDIILIVFFQKLWFNNNALFVPSSFLIYSFIYLSLLSWSSPFTYIYLWDISSNSRTLYLFLHFVLRSSTLMIFKPIYVALVSSVSL